MDKKDIEKSYNLRAFEKSDASLKFIKTILIIATVLTSGAAVILGFVFLDSSGGVFGWLLLFGGPALFIFLYFVSMFTLWTIYDIKMIRNALYDAEPSASLKSFAGEWSDMSSSTSTGDAQKTFYGAEPTSQSQTLSSEDTMKKYEEWLANGTITKEEFEALKRKNGN